MTINLLADRGTPLERQNFAWKELVQKPISKLDDDAFTRVRTILMNGVELDSLRMKQVLLRMNGPLRVPVARLMRAEQHQATLINWLIGADHSLIETTIGYEQTAIEVTASVAQLESNAYLAHGYRYALLEDFVHLYRYSALLDRLEGKDANNITQGYTDIVPARPTRVHHRSPEHDVLEPYAANSSLATKLHALTLTGGEYQTHDYYMTIGPLFSDPIARQLYAEIASVESQHIVHYGSMINPDETPLEKMLLQEACEVWNHSAKPERVREIVDQVLGDLELHTALEEEFLYPAARDAITEPGLIDEAEVEHESAKALIEQLKGLNPEDEKYAARFTVLCEYVMHHVKEEETELFPQLQTARLDWVNIAREMSERRSEMVPAEGMEAETEAETQSN